MTRTQEPDEWGIVGFIILSSKLDWNHPGRGASCGGIAWHPREVNPVTFVFFVDSGGVPSTQSNLEKNPSCGIVSVVDSGGSAVRLGYT